jgi:hypothetical protein
MLLLACCFGSLGSKAGRINYLCHGGKTSQLKPGQEKGIYMENLHNRIRGLHSSQLVYTVVTPE